MAENSICYHKMIVQLYNKEMDNKKKQDGMVTLPKRELMVKWNDAVNKLAKLHIYYPKTWR